MLTIIYPFGVSLMQNTELIAALSFLLCNSKVGAEKESSACILYGFVIYYRI